MSLKLITYDLQGAQNATWRYDLLYEFIKNLGSWYHPLESVWFVQSSFDIKAIRDSLEQLIQTGDKLVVIEVKDWATYGFLMGDNARAIMHAA